MGGEYARKQTTSGFTIIEVVLVLAIAGLIFLIVFLVLPQAQRLMRDNQRRAASEQTLANLEFFRGKYGHYPITATEQTTFKNDYKLDIDNPSTGDVYDVKFSSDLANTHNITPEENEIIYAYGHWCSETGPDLVEGNHADATVVTVIITYEVGGVECLDNR